MCTREGETEVEATISTSYSEEDEEEVEELVEVEELEGVVVGAMV